MSGFVGRLHEFHNRQYVEDWSVQFEPTPPRLELFDGIIERLAGYSFEHRHIVELGIGPGYLAERMLPRIVDVTYEGVDFSEPMLQIAERRLPDFQKRITFTQIDLLSTDWMSKLKSRPGAIVSTWALHDLGGEAETMKVYADCKAILPAGGIFLNGDFVKPDDTLFEFEPGRFPVSRHIELLKTAGFRNVGHGRLIEPENLNPTPAQNYVCFEAYV